MWNEEPFSARSKDYWIISEEKESVSDDLSSSLREFESNKCRNTSSLEWNNILHIGDI